MRGMENMPFQPLPGAGEPSTSLTQPIMMRRSLPPSPLSSTMWGLGA